MCGCSSTCAVHGTYKVSRCLLASSKHTILFGLDLPMAQYDNCAAEYTMAKKDSFRVDVEYFTFLHRMLLATLGKVGNLGQYSNVLAGKRVLDLACGDGHYTRECSEATRVARGEITIGTSIFLGQLKEQLGASDVVGVDISQGMIDIARGKEQERPLGITYAVADAQKLSPPEAKYDVVTAFYLLNFAQTSEELERMVRVIGEQLADGQHFYGTITNVCGDPATYNNDKHRKYAFKREANFDAGPLQNGAEVKYTHFNDKEGTSFSYVTYYLSPDDLRRGIPEGGFHPFQMGADGKRPKRRGQIVL